jgi:selenophosphate synthetase-related protein
MEGSENSVVNMKYVYVKIHKILMNNDDTDVIKINYTYTVIAKHGTYDK